MHDSHQKSWLDSLLAPKTLIPVIGVLCLLFVAAAIFIVRNIYGSGIPDIGAPFDVEEYSFIEIADRDNAFLLYRKAIPKFIPRDKIVVSNPEQYDAAVKSYDETLTNGWEQANDDVRQWLAENDEALAIWKQGTQCSDGIEIQPGRFTMNTLLGTTQSLRELARLAILKAEKEAHEGSPAEAWQWYRATLRSSRHVGMHGCMTSRMVGSAIHTLAAKEIPQWAARPDVDAELLQQALVDVKQLDQMTTSGSENMKIEYFVTTSGFMILQRGAGARALFNVTGENVRMRKVVNLIYANWIEAFDQPFHLQDVVPTSELSLFDVELKHPEESQTILPADIDKWSQQGFVFPKTLRMFVPAVSSFRNVLTRERVRQIALELTLALQIHFREKGRFPETLDPLVGKLLNEIPIDPYGKGEPIRYRRGADATEPAILWSIASDGIDQKGEIDWEFGRQPGDYVFKITPPAKPPE